MLVTREIKNAWSHISCACHHYCLTGCLALVVVCVHFQDYCRKCQKFFCASCAPKTIVLPTHGPKPVRVCNPCYAVIAASASYDPTDSSRAAQADVDREFGVNAWPNYPSVQANRLWLSHECSFAAFTSALLDPLRCFCCFHPYHFAGSQLAALRLRRQPSR